MYSFGKVMINYGRVEGNLPSTRGGSEQTRKPSIVRGFVVRNVV